MQSSIKDLICCEVEKVKQPEKLQDWLRMVTEKDWSQAGTLLKSINSIAQVKGLKEFVERVLGPIAEAQAWVKALIGVVQVVVEVKRESERMCFCL